MAIPLRTRSDLKRAGRAIAAEAVDSLAADFLKLTPEQMGEEAHVEAMTAAIVDTALGVARGYLEAGIPEPWVRSFMNSYHRTALARLADHSLAVRPAAGSA